MRPTFKAGLCGLILAVRLLGAESALILPPPNPLSHPVKYLHYYPPHFWAGLQKTADWRPDASLLIAGAVLIPTAFLCDESVRNFAIEEDFYSADISRIGNIYAHRWGYFAAAAAVGVNGCLRRQPWHKTFSQIELLGTSVITTSLVTEAIKIVSHRERPNGANNKSFPSGHTSGSFALAAGLDEIYGRTIGIPAYLMAVFVASTRINDNKHYLSDVVAGAFIGTWIGRSFARQYHLEWQISAGKSPVVTLAIPL